MAASTGESCTWCGAAVEPGNGFRAHQPAAQRYAVFCRLEHIVPWELQGEEWLPGPIENPGIPGREAEEMPGSGSVPGSCSHCEARLGDTPVLLIRHRGEHRIADGFCSSVHLAAWAKAGGRWR